MIIGQQKIISYLQNCLDTGKLGHAYFFAGPEGVGKNTVAIDLAQALVCASGKKLGEDCQCQICRQIQQKIWPDFYYVTAEADKNEITIDQVRRLINQLSLSGFQSKNKVAIIDGAELLNQAAANCLLKTLEEPTKDTLIILVSSRPQMVLSTLKSRCQEIVFNLVVADEIASGLKMLYNNMTIADCQKLAGNSFGRPGKVKSLLEAKQIKSKTVLPEAVLADLQSLAQSDLATRFAYVKKGIDSGRDWQDLLRQWPLLARQALLTGLKVETTAMSAIPVAWQNCSHQELLVKIKLIEKTQMMLQQTGLNHRLVLEILMLDL